MYTLPLHDALPISRRASRPAPTCSKRARRWKTHWAGRGQQLTRRRHERPGGFSKKPSTRLPEKRPGRRRSEEHTSELQSRLHLVCRLLLEKKNRGLPNRCQRYPRVQAVSSLPTLAGVLTTTREMYCLPQTIREILLS